MNRWHWSQISSTNPGEKYNRTDEEHCLYSLAESWQGALWDVRLPCRDLCCMTYVFHYCSFSNIFSGLVASQSAWEGGLGPPEIDLFLQPNCLLNIIDHQSCQRKEGRREGRRKKWSYWTCCKKGKLSVWSYLSENRLSWRQSWEAENRSYFNHLFQHIWWLQD